MRLLPLLGLMACASADAMITLGEASLEAIGCETGERHAVTEAVALLFEDDGPLVQATLIVQDSGDSATVYAYQDEESIPGSGVYSYSLAATRECGLAELSARGYSSGGYAPIDGRFELDCLIEVDGVELALSGGGEAKGCR
ncbi:MAG: hypothetical protein H6741_18850 [Alphaproteobacteria bacterium]|nr:hypothetical protein [Alphaproteobacteria bacterium]MCB9794769.1 hypothetical protein [Alphaproteobacteria bacterium]